MKEIILPESKTKVKIKKDLNYGEYRDLGRAQMKGIASLQGDIIGADTKKMTSAQALQMIEAGDAIEAVEMEVLIIFTDIDDVDFIRKLSIKDVEFLKSEVGAVREEYEKKNLSDGSGEA